MQNDSPIDPFSKELRALFRQIKSAKTKEERLFLMRSFAIVFASEQDLTDFTANDAFHKYIEDYEKAALAFEHASLGLARMGMDFMQHVGIEEDAEDDVHPPASSRGMN